VGRDLFALRKEGTEFPVEISLSPFRTDNDELFVIAFIIDITRRKEAENKLKNYSIELEQQVEQRTLILSEAINELEKTKEELNDALVKEKELNDLKSRFVSMVSHEFRTPLATILSSLALVRKYGELNEREKQEKHLERIKTAVNNLTDMLNDVLSLSKLEEGRMPVIPEPADIAAFVKDIIQEMQAVTPQGQAIRYTHSGHAQPVMMDKKILRHILFNLLSNAIKFSPEKSPVEVRTELGNDMLELQIQDRGIGIADEDQKHMFERFFRAQNAVNIQGTGLGLNIVARYIDLLAGSIQLQSRLGEGTLFIIRIPIPVS
jgi:signal transduction histidine kinase